MEALLVDEARRVVLLWIGRLGDVLVSTPLLRALRARCPRARLILVTGEAGEGAARLCPDIDEYRVLRPFVRAAENAALVRELRAQPADLLIDLNSSFSRAAWSLALVSGARMKIGFAKGRGDWIYSQVLAPPPEKEPMSGRYARLAEALGASVEPALSVKIPDEARIRGERRAATLDPGRQRLLVGIHPGNFKKFDNRWPEANFVGLLEKLAGREGMVSFLLAGPGEEGQVRGIAGRLRRPVLVLGSSDIESSAGLLASVDLLIGNVTGTTHLAIAAGTPTFTLRSGYTHCVWMPRTEAHPHAVSRSWTSCRDISVAEAWAALEPALERLASRRAQRQ